MKFLTHLEGRSHKIITWLLFAFCLVQIFGFFYYINFSQINGYLPSPFIYDKSDTFMDLFNTMYWAFNDGRYTEWGSVYPPLNFLFLQLLNWLCGSNISDDPFQFRDTSDLVIMSFVLIYLSIPIFVLRTSVWKQFSFNHKVLIYIAVVLSTPMLFTLERGNLIIVAPILLAVVLSDVSWYRVLSIALLINLKPYFVLLLLVFIVKHNWKAFWYTGALTGAVFLLTGLIVDSHFYVFFSNILSFSQEESLFSLREVMAMPSSISAIAYALKDPSVFSFASSYVNSDLFLAVVNAIDQIKWGIILFSAYVFFKKSEFLTSNEVLCGVVILISNMGVWVGGYSVILYVSIIPILITLRARCLYIGILVIIALPLDMLTLVENLLGTKYSFLSGSMESIEWTLGAGSLIRPVINIVFLFFLFREFLSRFDGEGNLMQVNHLSKIN